MIELHIQVDDNGQCTVLGPLENPLICYGMLEVARDAIREHAIHAAKEARKGILQVPPGSRIPEIKA